jgi:iron complex outermembrane receptor protein
MAQHVDDDGAFGDLWLPSPDFLPDPQDIRLTTVRLADPFLETESDTVTVNVAWNLAFATLHSISGYAGNTLSDVDDCAGIPPLAGCVRSALPFRHRQFSQEARLVSRDDTDINWIVGAYYYDDDAIRDYFQFTPALHSSPSNDSFTKAAETTAAVFGEATWRFAPGWSATAGLRLNREEHHLATIGTGFDDAQTGASAEESANNDSWRVDLQYTAGDDVLLYAGVSTGFKSGGLVVQGGGVLDNFAPEELIAYEAGIKSQWLGRRARLNAAAFYYDFRDLQVSTFTLSDDDLIFETDNAAKAEIYGIDAEVAMKATDRLELSGGVVWLPKREFVEYRNDRTGDTLSGNDLARAPEWTATTVIEYSHPLRSNGRYSARLEYNYRSRFFYTTDNEARFSQHDFGLLNLFLRYEAAGGRWYVFASGRNLGDQDYFNQVFLQASPGYPDTYEAGFGYRW